MKRLARSGLIASPYSANRDLQRQNGAVFYLQNGPEILYRTTSNPAKAPQLLGQAHRSTTPGECSIPFLARFGTTLDEHRNGRSQLPRSNIAMACSSFLSALESIFGS